MMDRRLFLAKQKWIRQTLILSLFFNLTLLVLFFYFFIGHIPSQWIISYLPSKKQLPQVMPFPIEKIIKDLSAKGFTERLEYLKETREVEWGYQVRHVALTLLIEKDHFDLERALGSKVASQKKYRQSSGREFALFSELTERDFQKILHFAFQERWPLTAQGLFLALKSGESDASCALSFLQSEEFFTVQRLFVKSGRKIQRGILMQLLLEGSWQTLHQWHMAQRREAHFSEEGCREFLLTYLKEKSSTAAYLLLLLDSNYLQRFLRDEELMQLLSLLKERTRESVHFLRALIESPRSEAIHALAKAQLLAYGTESPEESLEQTLSELKSSLKTEQIQPQKESEEITLLNPRPAIGELRPLFREHVSVSSSPRMHVIQAGETLWTISRRYQVSLDALMRLNGLQSYIIQPGHTLHLPRSYDH